jgi:hypothetical protein
MGGRSGSAMSPHTPRVICEGQIRVLTVARIQLASVR